MIERHAAQMCSDDDDRHRAVIGLRYTACLGDYRHAILAHSRIQRPVHGVGEEGERIVGKGWADQRHAGRQVTVRVETGRNGDCRAIEQIDEVGVPAEMAVFHNRIRHHLLDRIGGRRGRRHQDVRLLPFLLVFCRSASSLYLPSKAATAS